MRVSYSNYLCFIAIKLINHEMMKNDKLLVISRTETF